MLICLLKQKDKGQPWVLSCEKFNLRQAKGTKAGVSNIRPGVCVQVQFTETLYLALSPSTTTSCSQLKLLPRLEEKGVSKSLGHLSLS